MGGCQGWPDEMTKTLVLNMLQTTDRLSGVSEGTKGACPFQFCKKSQFFQYFSFF